jgi:lipopolysaccharide transport system ATP-binding protein
MSRREIKSKFDEIVAFAEVEKYLDTPVKRYSSGMYVRLAFAVAAHLEPEILLVDEVLAVGDAEFQKKCLGKMGEVASGGRTVLFVSHNMGMITSLCRRAILLDEGMLSCDDDATVTVTHYHGSRMRHMGFLDVSQRKPPVGDHRAILKKAWIENGNGQVISEVDLRHEFSVKMLYEVITEEKTSPYPNFHFYQPDGQCVFVASGKPPALCQPGTYEAECVIPGGLLNNNTYFINLALTFIDPQVHVSFHEQGALAVTVIDPISETLQELRHGYSGPIPGAVRPKLDWNIRRLS